MREQYESALGDVKDLARDMRDRTKDMDMINIRDTEVSYDLEGGRLYLLEAQPKLVTRELETRKVWFNLDYAVMYLCFGHQEERQGEIEIAGIDSHEVEEGVYYLLGVWGYLRQGLRSAGREKDDAW